MFSGNKHLFQRISLKINTIHNLELIIKLFIIISLCTIPANLIYKEWKKKPHELYLGYKKAIESGDKQKALDAGRKYYSFKGGSISCIVDEQSIGDDLSKMKGEKLR